MPMLIEKQVIGDGSFFYRDRNTGDEFARIVAGLAWPFADKPGYMVVLSEAKDEDPALGARIIKVIHEKETPYISDIVRVYQEIVNQFKCQPVLGDPKNGLYQQLKQQSKQFGVSCPIFEPPHVYDPENFGVYYQLFRDYLQPNRKALELGDSDLIRGYILAIPKENITGSVNLHPPLAALSYPLSYLHYSRMSGKMTQQRARELNKLHGGG